MTIATQDAADEQHRAGIVEALMSANRHAKRQQYVIEKFSTDPPTPWTRAHGYVDSLITQWEAAH